MKQQMFQTSTKPDSITAQSAQTSNAAATTAQEQQVERVEVEQAEVVAQEAGAEVAGKLFTDYEREIKRHNRRLRRATRTGVSVAIGMTLVDLVAILVAAQAEMEYSPAIIKTCIHLLILGAVLLSACGFAAISALVQRRRARAEVVSTALKRGDACMVGPLSEMLLHPRTRPQAAEALIALLPLLLAHDAHLLNDEQRQCLCNVLRNGAREDHALRVAILRATARIGDRSMLMLVERIADSPAKTWRQRELKEEAQKCLPALRLRTQHEAASRTLLRASGATSAAPDSLLRAAAGNAESAPEQLLRSSNKEQTVTGD